MSENLFKKCPSCQQKWETQDAFLSDPLLNINGYTANFKNLEGGLFFFTHRTPGCCSTMAVEVRDFKNLYNGPYYKGTKAGQDGCPRYCLDSDQLERCTAFCECAFVREILQIIKNWHKTENVC